MSDLGYVTVDRLTLRDAEERAQADACSAVVRHAEVETASARARRVAATASHGGRLLSWPVRSLLTRAGRA